MFAGTPVGLVMVLVALLALAAMSLAATHDSTHHDGRSPNN